MLGPFHSSLRSLAFIACAVSSGGTCAASDGFDGGVTLPSVRSAYPRLAAKPRAPAASSDGSRTRGFQASTETADPFRHYEASNFALAMKEIQELIAQLRKDGPAKRPELAAALDFRGVVQQRQGKLFEAIDSHKEALQLLAGAGRARQREVLTARNNLAVAQYLAGEYESAEKVLGEILDEPEVKGLTRARAQNNRGLIYAETGRASLAGGDFDDAIADARQEQSPQARRLLAQVLNNQARVWSQKKNRVAAEGALTEALQLSRALGDSALEANVLDTWAEMLMAAGDFPAALEKLTAASAAEAKADAPLVRTTILMNRGRALAGLGKPADALKAWEDALAQTNDMGLYAMQREILASRAQLHVGAGQLDLAFDDYKSAIDLAEQTRQRLPRESAKGFIEATKSLYAGMVALLLKRKNAGDVELAFAYLERSQSARLQEQLAKETPALRDRRALGDIQGTRGVLHREAALAQQLQARLAAPAGNAAEIRTLRKQLEAVRREAIRALAELEDKYKGRYNLFVPAAISPKQFADIQAHLPPKGLLVAFSVAEDGLYFFIASKDGKVEFRQNLNVTKAELERRIEEYRTLVTKKYGSQMEDWRIDSWSDAKWVPLRDATAWLYQQILEPIADRIKDADQLIIAPTGQLYYLPLHALGPLDAGSGQVRFLAADKKISYVTPGSLFKVLDAAAQKARSAEAPRMLALGNVTFEPPLPQLAHSKDELASISGIFGGSAVVLEGARATKREFLRALGSVPAAPRKATAPAGKEPPGRFTLVHLATHGILDASHPNLSRLAFEGSNSLATHEIAGLDLRGVSLVTLSACETALADDNPGADLMSLGEYVSLAGAASVIVTLWSVDDFQTSNLMNQLYSRLKQDGTDRLAALQGAQLALAGRPESRHPYFWAPFILYGKGW